ncbi:hypothetical protein [Rickettsia endosymbiont of Cardiosporidium cionae]|uniref:hypothetical protein n=1 Tax=Rickettsia endosymbiont of Cardiosporidium cionae TaxID=2777155 RepID=UPI0018940CFD|nr:hypothetical protein [Rickettsia endosymbiont of Cardiosporidium cionae]KAF8818122.1 hypothetical protein IHI24_000851 [Rickettsia endosymbiont of Cardiosporidium cionae]
MINFFKNILYKLYANKNTSSNQLSKNERTENSDNKNNDNHVSQTPNQSDNSIEKAKNLLLKLDNALDSQEKLAIAKLGKIFTKNKSNFLTKTKVISKNKKISKDKIN